MCFRRSSAVTNDVPSLKSSLLIVETLDLGGSARYEISRITKIIDFFVIYAVYTLTF